MRYFTLTDPLWWILDRGMEEPEGGRDRAREKESKEHIYQLEWWQPHTFIAQGKHLADCAHRSEASHGWQVFDSCRMLMTLISQRKRERERMIVEMEIWEMSNNVTDYKTWPQKVHCNLLAYLSHVGMIGFLSWMHMSTSKSAWNGNSPNLFFKCMSLILLWMIHQCMHFIFNIFYLVIPCNFNPNVMTQSYAIFESVAKCEKATISLQPGVSVISQLLS